MKILYTLLVASFFVSCSTAQTKTVDAAKFNAEINNSGNIILDVRTAEEFESGHITGALQADWNNQAQFIERIASIDKHAEIYIYCLAGGRSNAAMNYMAQQGYTHITNLKGGINAWNQAGLPVEGQSNVPQLTLKDFTASIPQKGTILVDFSATWCPPCKKMEPIIASLEKQKYQVMRIDGGEQKDLSAAMKISGFPTIIIYKDGVETYRKTGIISEEELLKALQ